MQIATAGDGVLRPRRMPKGLRNPLHWGVGDRLRALGIEHNLTQTLVASVSGVGSTTISQIEHSKASPRIDIVERLATALGVSPIWLAFGEHGQQIWTQRHPRSPVPHDLPVPVLTERPFVERHKGMGARLKRARDAKGLTLRAIGPLIEERWRYLKDEKKTISRQTILLLEAGVQVPIVKTCEAIALALDVSPGWLAFGDEDEKS